MAQNGYYIRMKKRVLKDLFTASFLFISICTLAFVSCQKAPRQSDVSSAEKLAEPSDEKPGIKKVVPSWHPSEKKICILFGYGYNDKAFTEETISALGAKYGLDDGTSQGGLILPFVFPDDFRDSRIMRLADKLEDVDLAGVITIGAPENTNYALAKIEEEWDNHLPYPVYSFFPQDDVLGIEATSNFVVDRAMEGTGISSGDSSEGGEEGSEEILQTRIEGMDKILDSAIECMLLSEQPLPGNKELMAHVQRIVGPSHTVSRFSDPESGLESINHFVIDSNVKTSK